MGVIQTHQRKRRTQKGFEGGGPVYEDQTLAHCFANCSPVLCYNSPPTPSQPSQPSCRPVYHRSKNVLFGENNMICHASCTMPRGVNICLETNVRVNCSRALARKAWSLIRYGTVGQSWARNLISVSQTFSTYSHLLLHLAFLLSVDKILF